MLKEIVIIDAIRTAVGNFSGSLSTIPATELGKQVIKSIIQRNKIDPSIISEVIMGQVLTGGAGQNPARQAAYNAGIPMEVPAFTVSKVCGSGLKSVALAASSIATGDNDVVIAGGQENMSMSSHAIFMRTGTKFGDLNMVDMMIKDGLTDAFLSCHMGVTAENIAKKYNISREEQDNFAYNSQIKATHAQNTGKFKDEILPITVINKKSEIIFDQDEFIRSDVSLEALSKLRPAFEKDGTVTAGNASGINDGAAALLVTSREFADKFGHKPLAKIVSYASAGVDPAIMGIGPVAAIKKALTKANWDLKDVELIELNEAFAAQSIAVSQLLGLDPAIVNVNGGAIAIGHPIGASGARVLTSLIYEMQRRKVKKSLVSLCIGGGMGIAMCLESC